MHIFVLIVDWLSIGVGLISGFFGAAITWVIAYSIFKQKVLDDLKYLNKEVDGLKNVKGEVLQTTQDLMKAQKQEMDEKFNVCHKRIDRTNSNIQGIGQEITKMLSGIVETLHYMRGKLDSHIESNGKKG